MSAADVQRATGIHLQTVLRLENNEQQFTPKYLEALAPVYECDLRDFLPEGRSALSEAELALIKAVRAQEPFAVRDAIAAVLPAREATVAIGGRALEPISREELVEAIQQATAGLTRIAQIAKSKPPAATPPEGDDE